MRNLIVSENCFDQNLFWSFIDLNCDINVILFFGYFLCQWVDFKIFSHVYITYRVVSLATEPEQETGS